MQAYVLTDKALERQAGRFVWLSVNTENGKNADFLAKYKIAALPTLMVLDRTGDNVLMRYVGAATVPQLSKMLDDARAKSSGAWDTALAAGDRAAAQGKHEEAAKFYASALDSAPRNWSRRVRAAEALVVALSFAGNNEECVARARALHASLGRTAAAAGVAATGLGCATSLPEQDERRRELILELDGAARAAFHDPAITLSADDRSGFYIVLIGAREALNDKTGARKLTEEWSAFLDRTAAAAKTPQQRTVYDSHRLSAYMELGTPEKAIPMLEQSERDFPDDYNPPSRLALAYRAMKKYDDAIAASDRALARAYGPRKITILRARADIYTAMGDKEGARKTISDAIAYAKSLPAAQRSDRTLASLEKKLTELAN